MGLQLNTSWVLWIILSVVWNVMRRVKSGKKTQKFGICVVIMDYRANLLALILIFIVLNTSMNIAIILNMLHHGQVMFD